MSIDSSSFTVGTFEVANVTASVAYALSSGAEEGQIWLRVVDQRDGRPQVAGASEMSWKLAALESLTTDMSSPNFLRMSANLSSLHYFDDRAVVYINLYSRSGNVGLPTSDPSAFGYFKVAFSQTMAAALAHSAGSSMSLTPIDMESEIQYYSSYSINSVVQIDFDYRNSKIADQISAAFEDLHRDWRQHTTYVYWNNFNNYIPIQYAGSARLTSGSRMYASACSINYGSVLNLFLNGQQVTFNTGCDLTFVSTAVESTIYELRVSCSYCSSFSGYVFYSYGTSADAFDFLGTLNRTLYEASGGSVSFNANMATLQIYEYFDMMQHNHFAPTLQLATSVSFDRNAYEMALSERASTDMSLTASGRFGFDLGSVDGNQGG